MEKRLLLAVVLMISVIFLSNVLFPPIPRPGPEPGEGTPPPGLTAPGAEADGETEFAAGAAAAVDSIAALDTARRAVPSREDTVVVQTPLFTLRFATRGAALVGAELARYESYAPNGEEGRRVQLVRPNDRLFGYAVAAGADTLSFADRIFEASRDTLVVRQGAGPDSLVFRHRIEAGGATLAFVITHTFDPERYLLRTSGRLEGFTAGWSVVTSLGRGLKTNEANPDEDYRDAEFVVNGRRGGIVAARLDAVDPGEIRAAEGGPFNWVAVKSKYFLVALIASPTSPGFGGLLVSGLEEEHAARLAASFPVPEGSPGFAYEAYLGPQDYARLEAVGQDLQNVNPYGWRWLQWAIRPLVAIVMFALTWLHRAFDLAYGWVLILFGVLLRIVLFPLYQKSMRSQIEQMRIQPLMKELQTKHKEDPQKLQQEMIRLYKEHGVNPLSGCLPMMLPMPVLFTLFFVFQGTIEFRGVPFLWLPDLSLKDPYYIIPLIMGASMYLLSWIGQRGIEQNPQMKVMMYALPIVFTVLFLNFPSGLNLYYATSNLASLPQQWYLSRERRVAMARPGAKPGTGSEPVEAEGRSAGRVGAASRRARPRRS